MKTFAVTVRTSDGQRAVYAYTVASVAELKARVSRELPDCTLTAFVWVTRSHGGIR